MEIPYLHTRRLLAGINNMEKPLDEIVEVGFTLPPRQDGAEVLPNPEDPMNWSWLQKHSILACISLLGGLGTYAGLFVVPA